MMSHSSSGLLYLYIIIVIVSRTESKEVKVQQNGDGGTYRPAVYFQWDGIPSVDSRLVWNDSIPAMRAITACFHVRFQSPRSDTVPMISYSVESFPDEFTLYFDFRGSSVEIVCCGGRGRISHHTKEPFLFLHTWIHFCISIDLRSDEYVLAINSDTYFGTLDLTDNSALNIEKDGIFMLGQEQDFHGGGFNIKQSFEGVMADLFIFSRTFGTDDLKEFIACNPVMTNDAIMSFQSIDTDWISHGSINIQNLTEADICTDFSTKDIIFPELRSLEESKQLCRMLKGEIATPENDEENKKLVEASKNFVNNCSTNWGMYLWIGLRAEVRNGIFEFVNIHTNKTATYTPFRNGYDRPIDDYRCAFMDSYKIGMWAVYPCTFKTCTVCTFKELPLLRLRGLCIDSMIDRQYMIMDIGLGKPVFDGTTNSKILWEGNLWMIRNALDTDIQGSLRATNHRPYPFGLRRWNITGDSCQNTAPLLLLTACRSDQYTCNDGTCIRKMQRCDLEVNCPDKSDENSCSAVVVPDDYIKEVPPARIGTEPALIYLTVSIMSIQPIDTLGMNVMFDVNVTLLWRDNRLDMLSLNYAETLNVIRSGDRIWQPEFLFEDFTGSEADSIMRWETFVAVMQSGPLADDITRVKEDEVYPGANNSLKMTQTYHVKMSCQMNFVNYPFDTQRCYFRIRMQYFTKDLVSFNTSGEDVDYQGAKNVGEYKVKSLKMILDDWHNYSGRKIIISMDNLSGFHISSTYIPTFLMVVISYSTLFFNLEDFQDRIMVSLTALLVLATLFTQISETTPKTSYLKLLDVWFVATIFINFSVVILLVFINYLKLQENHNLVAPIQRKKFVYPVPERSRKVNAFCQVAIPVILFILVLAYIVFSTL